MRNKISRNDTQYSFKVPRVPVHTKVFQALTNSNTFDFPRKELHINHGDIIDNLAYCVGALEPALVGKKLKFVKKVEMKEASPNAVTAEDEGTMYADRCVELECDGDI